MSNRSRFRLLAACAVLLLADPALSLVAGQVDDFQDGTLQGWTGGVLLTNQPGGGPAGAGDRYLEADSLAANLATFNPLQWAGDYDAEAIDEVQFDLNNFGPDTVSLRLLVFSPGCTSGAGTCTAWASTAPTVLTAGSGWVTAGFALTEVAMTQVFGTDTLLATLQDADQLLLRHDPDPVSPPGNSQLVNAVIGVDNITALPEPSGAVGLLFGALALTRMDRSRRGRGCRRRPC